MKLPIYAMHTFWLIPTLGLNYLKTPTPTQTLKHSECYLIHNNKTTLLEQLSKKNFLMSLTFYSKKPEW
jgi:hypothetical protein